MKIEKEYGKKHDTVNPCPRQLPKGSTASYPITKAKFSTAHMTK